MDQHVAVSVEGRAGRLRLNRPEALNALTPAMIERCSHALMAWRDDPGVHLVVVEGIGREGAGAFCAGGDIRTIHASAVAGDHRTIEAFFRAEYGLDEQIAEYPKPCVALIDGACMGGGLGLAMHGSHRVATQNALCAMPETAIALFPDVGATYVLPRLPGRLGMFLALTGTRMKGADAVHAGLATHFVSRARLPALSAALSQDGAAALAGFAEPLPPFTLAPHRDAIDRCFSAPSVAGIASRLAAEGSEWGDAALALLRTMSPSSLAWSFEIVRAGAGRTLPQCLAAELQLTRAATRHPDFVEGVRAMVIDKDRAPKWSPARIEDVDPAGIARMFA